MSIADKAPGYVPGCGPFDAEIMFIGEAPGVAEEIKGRPFVGKTGVEMKRLCTQAGIKWEHTYRTNVVKYRPLTRAKSGNVKPTAADVRRDEGELVDELERIRPRFVVAVGAVAARWVLGREFTSMEDCHAFAFEAQNWRACGRSVDASAVGIRNRNTESSRRRPRVADGESDVARSVPISPHRFVCVIVYHPASGLHSPENQPLIYFDFMQLGRFVRGELPLTRPIDEHPDPDYYEPRGAVQLIANAPIAVDTEGLRGRVWGLSYAQTPGSAGVIRKTNKRALASIKAQLLGA